MLSTKLGKVSTPAVKDAIEAAHDDAVTYARREVRSLKGIIAVLAVATVVLVVWNIILTGVVISHNVGDEILEKTTNAMVEQTEVSSDEAVINEVVVAVDASTPLLEKMVENQEETFSFYYQLIEEGRSTGNGRTSCGDMGPVLYGDTYESGARSVQQDGVWIAVSGCGDNGYDLRDNGDIARIFLPLESFKRVSSAYDLFEALRRDGTLYWINQASLAQALNISAEDLPVNMDLPTAP